MKIGHTVHLSVQTPSQNRFRLASEAAPAETASPRGVPVTPGSTNGRTVTSGAPVDWLLWQLVDSAFPAGGLAHSGGLEAAWQHGEVRSPSEFAEYLSTGLGQIGRAILPFLTGAHREPERWAEIDETCDVFITNHVANRASRLQGRAWLSSVERVFAQVESEKLRAHTEPAYLHFAPVYGVTTRLLGLDPMNAARLFLFCQLRSLLSAGVRLGIVGPLKAQSLQHRLAPTAEKVLLACFDLKIENAAQNAPLLDLWQGAQDRLYSRLFQS